MKEDKSCYLPQADHLLPDYLRYAPPYSNYQLPPVHARKEAEQPSLQQASQHNQLKAPNIVIHGFHDLHHFLSWFQIDARHPLIFPAGQERSIKQERGCIIISGFLDLEDFLAWFSHDHSRRPPMKPLSKRTNDAEDY